MQIRNRIAAFFLLAAVAFSFSAPYQAHAQTTDFAVLGATILQTAKDAGNFIWTGLKEAGLYAYEITQKTAVKSLMRRYVLKFAESAAKRVATGGKGGGPLFDDKPFKDELKSIVVQETADYIQYVIKDFTGFDVCEPFDPRLKVAIINKAGADSEGGTGANQRPTCDLNNVLANYNKVAGIYEKNKKLSLNDRDFLGKLWAANGDMVSIEQKQGKDYGIAATVGGLYGATPTGDVAVALFSLSSLREKKSEAEKNAAGSLGNTTQTKPVTNALGNKIKTPAEFVRASQEKAQADASTPDLTPTDNLAVDALGVFANTLAFEMLKRLTEKGLNPTVPGSGFKPLAPPGSLGRVSSVAAEEFSSLFGQAQISTTAGSMNALNDLMTCPEQVEARVPNNCMITANFRQAIDQKMTVAEAIKADLLPGSFLLGFRTDEKGKGVEPKYNEGLSYRSLLILQKYRVVPRAWVIAAEYVRDQGSKAGEPTFKNLIEAYGDNTSPFYRLVDPNWVLTAPAQYCALSGPSGLIQTSNPARVPDETIVSSGTNPTVKTTYKLVNQINRAQYCADERTCVKEGVNGQCLYYGYCTREKPIWRFKGSECPAPYDSCQAYAKADGTSVAYLSNSLSGTNPNFCNASSAGCQQYVAPAADGTTASVADLSSVLSQSSSGTVSAAGKQYGLAFFTDKLKTCSPAADGCTELVAVNQKNNAKQELLSAGAYPPSAARAYVTKVSQDCRATKIDPKLPEDYFVGCTTYAATDNSSNVVSAVARGQDLCSPSCVGFDTFDRQATDIGGGIVDSAQPFIDLIPSTAKSCSLQNVGCESFTDINAGSNAEAIVSYQKVRSCVAPELAGDGAKTYFTWQGNDTSGFGLKSWQLLASSDVTKKSATGAPAPCVSFDQETKTCNDAGAPVSCDRNVQLGTYKAGGVTKTGVPSASEILAGVMDIVTPNPDCREFIARDGSSFYALASRVISVSAECKQLRRTTDQKIYSILASDSVSCSNEFAGCRAFRGNTGYAGGTSVPLRDFKGPGALAGWAARNGNMSQDSATLESKSAGDSSMKMSGTKPSVAYVAVTADKALSASSNNVVTFVANGPADASLSVVLLEKKEDAKGGNVLATLGTAVLQGDWNSYSLAFRIPSDAVSSLATAYVGIESSADGVWIDNFAIRQSSDVYLIKNSWRTPTDGSGAPLCGVADLGCREYKAKNGENYNLSRFGNLCPMEFVGCQAFIDTKNTANAEAETKNIPYGPIGADGLPTSYSFVTQKDEVSYRVYNPDVQGLTCQPKETGCRLLGRVSYDYSAGASSASARPSKIENSYVLDRPDEYLVSNPVMCGPSAVGCVALKDPKGAGGDTFAYDPRGRTCTYDSISNAWYVTGQGKEPCPLAIAAPQDRFAKACEPTYSSCKLFVDGSVSNNGTPGCQVPADMRAYQPDHLASLGYDKKGITKLQGLFCQAYSYLDDSVSSGDCNGQANADTGCVEFGTRNDETKAISYPNGVTAYPQDKEKVLVGRVLQVQKDRICAESLVSRDGSIIDSKKSNEKEFVRRNFSGCVERSGPDSCDPEGVLSGVNTVYFEDQDSVQGPQTLDGVDVVTVKEDKFRFPSGTVSVSKGATGATINRLRQSFVTANFSSKTDVQYETFRYLSGISQAGAIIKENAYGSNPYPGMISARGLSTVVNYDGDFETIRAKLKEDSPSNVGYSQLDAKQLNSLGLQVASEKVASRVGVTNSTIVNNPFENIFSGQQALLAEGVVVNETADPIVPLFKIGSSNSGNVSFGVGKDTHVAVTASVLPDAVQGALSFEIICTGGAVAKPDDVYSNSALVTGSNRNAWKPLYLHAKISGSSGSCYVALNIATDGLAEAPFRFFLDSLNVGAALVNEALDADGIPYAPVLGGTGKNVQSPVSSPIVGPTCRVYPTVNAPSCEYVDENSRQGYSGYYGYCLVLDPADPRQCLQWFPADSVVGRRSLYDVDGSARKYEPKYKDRAGLSYCVESLPVGTMSGSAPMTDLVIPGKLFDGKPQDPNSGIIFPNYCNEKSANCKIESEFTIALDKASGGFKELSSASQGLYSLTVKVMGYTYPTPAEISSYLGNKSYSYDVRSLLGDGPLEIGTISISDFGTSSNFQNQGFSAGINYSSSIKCGESGWKTCVRFDDAMIWPVVKNGSLTGLKFKANVSSDYDDGKGGGGKLDGVISPADFVITLEPTSQAQYCKRVVQVVNESGEYAGWETRIGSLSSQSWLFGNSLTILSPGVIKKGYDSNYTDAVPYRSSIGETLQNTGNNDAPTSILAPFGSLSGTWTDVLIGKLFKPLYVAATSSSHLDFPRASYAWFKGMLAVNPEASKRCITVREGESTVASDADAQKCLDEKEGIIAGSYNDVLKSPAYPRSYVGQITYGLYPLTNAFAGGPQLNALANVFVRHFKDWTWNERTNKYEDTVHTPPNNQQLDCRGIGKCISNYEGFDDVSRSWSCVDDSNKPQRCSVATKRLNEKKHTVRISNMMITGSYSKEDSLSTNDPVQLCFDVAANEDQLPVKKIKVDWGDGTAPETLSGLENISSQKVCTVHMYVEGSVGKPGAEECVQSTQAVPKFAENPSRDSKTVPGAASQSWFETTHVDVIEGQEFVLNWSVLGTELTNIQLSGPGLGTDIAVGITQAGLPTVGSRRVLVTNASDGQRYTLKLIKETCTAWSPVLTCMSSSITEVASFSVTVNVKPPQKIVSSSGKADCFAIRVDAMDNWCWNTLDNPLNYSPASECDLPDPNNKIRNGDKSGQQPPANLPKLVIKVSNSN